MLMPHASDGQRPHLSHPILPLPSKRSPLSPTQPLPRLAENKRVLAGTKHGILLFAYVAFEGVAARRQEKESKDASLGVEHFFYSRAENSLSSSVQHKNTYFPDPFTIQNGVALEEEADGS
jgi:hypothetical protein